MTMKPPKNCCTVKTSLNIRKVKIIPNIGNNE